jgi:hypothetical protein
MFLTPRLSKPGFEMLIRINFFHTFIIWSAKRIMKNKIIIKTNKEVDNQQDKKLSDQNNRVVKKPGVRKIYTELAELGHEDFYSYLEWLGLAKKPDLFILPSSRHYYFEIKDLKNVKTVINLNQLNSIKRIKEFLLAVYNILPHKCYFIGSFTVIKNQNGFLTSKKSLHQIEGHGYIAESDEGPWNSFINMLYGIIDSKTNRYLTKKTVQFMLEDAGLKILDMTEYNGLTYFCSQKDKPSVE